jgi:hypothetical protein
VIAIGPYRFTETDANGTLRAGGQLFDLLTDGLAPSAEVAVAPHRRQAEAVMGDVGCDDPATALATFWDAWRAAMVAVRATGAFGPRALATATGLFRNHGGVPKIAEDRIEVDHAGVVGDRQANRTHHGRPWQALCLWDTGVIDAFRAQGHTLAPGAAGENVSLSGFDWARVRPGVHLRIGDVLAEVSAYAVPCPKNARWFSDGQPDRMHHRHGPVSRVYATVLEPGTIRLGDPAMLEPDPEAGP